MASCGVTAKAAYFVAGLAIGGAVALLLAPESGRKTRKYLADKAEEGKDYAAARGKEFRRQAEEFADRGREVITKQKERLADVLEAGRQVARSTVAR
jgi:gas vesicle protein